MTKSHPHESFSGANLVHWVPSSALGGIEMAALTLIQMTPTMRHVVVTGDASGPAADLWREAGAEVIQIESWGGVLGIAWAGRWKAFVNERGVRHLIAWSPTRLPQLLSPLDERCRCVVHLGNVGGFGRRARLQTKVMGLIYRPVCRPRLLACSKAVADSVVTEPAFHGLFLSVIPNSVRPAFFELGAMRSPSGAAPKTWGMLARLDRLKDHRSLIEAVRLLPVDLEFRLELAGEGALADELHRQVAAAGLEHRIRFLGALPRPQEAMRDWEAFIFATSAAEGFGIAVAEAMAAGLPCVLSDVAAMREVAGDSAYYAEQGSPAALCAQILEVINQPIEAHERAGKGRQRAQELYSAEVFARRYLSALGIA
jgi:glycosyltransferase involved in cell wall biosynthesis